MFVITPESSNNYNGKYVKYTYTCTCTVTNTCKFQSDKFTIQIHEYTVHVRKETENAAAGLTHTHASL